MFGTSENVYRFPAMHSEPFQVSKTEGLGLLELAHSGASYAESVC